MQQLTHKFQQQICVLLKTDSTLFKESQLQSPPWNRWKNMGPTLCC